MTRSELLRKGVHVAVGLGAFALVVLGPFYSALAVGAAILATLFLLTRIGGRRLWREDERRRGQAPGIVLYPVAVLILILAFWYRLEVAAAAWAILAVGDGTASLMGGWLGRRKLPWNPEKSWAGSLSYWLSGTAVAALVLVWTVALGHHPFPDCLPDCLRDGTFPDALRSPPISLLFVVVVAAVTALVSAFLESQPQRLDDNLTVPPLTGLVVLGLVASEGYWTSGFAPAPFLAALGSGAVIALGAAVVAYRVRAVSLSGAVAGGVITTVVWTFLGGRGFLLVAAFVVLGSGATRLGYRRKAARGLAQEGGGRRRARHAVANAGVATGAAVFAATTPYPELYLAAFAAALAAATGDTLSSEVGQLLGRRTILITTFAPVVPGTDGGISAAGSLAGLIGSFAIAVLGWGVGFYGGGGIAIVTLAATVGVMADSVLGATLERRGLVDNEGVNFLNTLTGALVAAGLSAWDL